MYVSETSFTQNINVLLIEISLHDVGNIIEKLLKHLIFVPNLIFLID